ncbi:MAG TPA: hypothetical protein VJQ82_18680 [Terriglobales bacterium]|nr:hypothetical protein [Terriglobales bacterium]
MPAPIGRLQAEFVDLLRKQVDALELDVYVGLTESERSQYDRRQERIRELNVKMRESSERASLADWQHSDADASHPNRQARVTSGSLEHSS